MLVVSLTILPPPRSTLFPYTTLFRSLLGARRTDRIEAVAEECKKLGARAAHAHALDVSKTASVEEFAKWARTTAQRSEEHTSELQSLAYLVCRLLLEKKNVMHTRPAS